MKNAMNLGTPVRLAHLAANPTDVEDGAMYFNTSVDQFKVYQRSGWRDLADEEWVQSEIAASSGNQPLSIDHNTTSLSVNNFYIIDMGGAGGNVTFTFPDMVTGDQFKALVYNNSTNGYLATFQTTTPQNMRYRGETDTSIQLTVPDTWVGGAWDNNDSVIAIYDASTFLTGTLAGDWIIEGDLTVDTDTLFVDSVNNRVGINTASPVAPLEILGETRITRSGIATQYIKIHPDLGNYIYGVSAESNKKYTIFGSLHDGTGTPSGSNGFQFQIGDESSPTTAMNIDNSGNVRIPYDLLVNDATTAPNNSSISVQFNASSSEEGINSVATGNVGSTHARYYNNTSNWVGSITTNNTACSFNDLSDSRIKTDLGSWSAIDMIKLVSARKYIKNREGASTEYGFFAQELYEVLPHAVSVGGDEVEKDPWMIDYSKTTGVLWKAIQELSAKNEEQQSLIDQLTARIEKLEGGL